MVQLPSGTHVGVHPVGVRNAKHRSLRLVLGDMGDGHKLHRVMFTHFSCYSDTHKRSLESI